MIGVQPGGLKMPSSFRSSQQKSGVGKPSRTDNRESILGWVVKNADTTVEDDSLRVSPTGRQPFIANANVRAGGPVEVRLRIKTPKNGTARLQWRTEGQDKFPQTGQSKSFGVAAGNWQEINVPLAVEGRLVHLRFFLSDSKRPTEIDWIEIGSRAQDEKDAVRWDFKVADKPAKRKPDARPLEPTTERPHSQTAPKAIHQPNVPRPSVILILADDQDESVTEVGWIHGENAAKSDRLAVI
jgi:hypothetical protein